MIAPDDQRDRPLDDLGWPAEDAPAVRRSYWPEIAALGTIICAAVPYLLASRRQPGHYQAGNVTVAGLVFDYLAMVISCGIVFTQLRG